jgi:hypothetical protein
MKRGDDGPGGSPGPLVDEVRFGNLVRAARIAAGVMTTREAAAALTSIGFNVSERSLSAIERGEQKITVALMVGACVAFRPPHGIMFFAPAIRQDAMSHSCPEQYEAPA